MTVRVIDIETTGVDPEDDGIIEIASMEVRRRHHHQSAVDAGAAGHADPTPSL